MCHLRAAHTMEPRLLLLLLLLLPIGLLPCYLFSCSVFNLLLNWIDKKRAAYPAKWSVCLNCSGNKCLLRIRPVRQTKLSTLWRWQYAAHKNSLKSTRDFGFVRAHTTHHTHTHTLLYKPHPYFDHLNVNYVHVCVCECVSANGINNFLCACC